MVTEDKNLLGSDAADDDEENEEEDEKVQQKCKNY